MNGALRRLVDIAGATVLTVVLSPILAGLAVAVRLTMGSPVFFRQLRPGYKGRPFEVVKFRTMREGDDLPDEERLTALGMPNAISVIAVAERGTLFFPGAALYMDKIAVGPGYAEGVEREGVGCAPQRALLRA